MTEEITSKLLIPVHYHNFRRNKYCLLVFTLQRVQFSILLVLRTADGTMTLNDESEMKSGIINRVDNKQGHKFSSLWWRKVVEDVEIVQEIVDHGRPAFFRRPHPSLWAGLLAARVEITIAGRPNLLNYCAWYNLAGRGLETHIVRRWSCAF